MNKRDRINVGYEISGLPKVITLEKLLKFNLWMPVSKNIHTDQEEARKAGFPTPIAPAPMSFGYLSELMTDLFGERWLREGKLTVSLIRTIKPGDTITAKGIVRSKQKESQGAMLEVEVWCENQQIEKVAVGTAQCSI
jgi:acyl dehydratase